MFIDTFQVCSASWGNYWLLCGGWGEGGGLTRLNHTAIPLISVTSVIQATILFLN